MNARERFLACMNFEPVDRGVLWEFGYWGGAIDRWYREGLPRRAGLSRRVETGETVCGPGLHWPVGDLLRDKDVMGTEMLRRQVAEATRIALHLLRYITRCQA